jgi:hypothetical protein
MLLNKGNAPTIRIIPEHTVSAIDRWECQWKFLLWVGFLAVQQLFAALDYSQKSYLEVAPMLSAINAPVSERVENPENSTAGGFI